MSWTEAAVHKYSNVRKGSLVVSNLIASLGQKRVMCTATIHASRWMYIIGGYDGNANTHAVHKLDLEEKRFADAPPRLNKARRSHGTTLIDGTIYVVGGLDGNETLDTIEKLPLTGPDKGAFWTIFSVPGFTRRSSPIVSSLSNSELLVSGGYNGTDLSDVVAINVKGMSSRTVIAESTFGFSCRNQAIVGEEGEIFALAWDKDLNVYAMHFSSSASTLQSIHCFGKQQD